MFMGDIIEYNRSTVMEVKLDDINHRFNTINREISGNTFNYHNINDNGQFYLTGITTGYYPEGYFYKPHYQIKLKDYSEIISKEELPAINNCYNFESGVTNSGEIVLLSGQNDDDIKSLIMRLPNLNGYVNNDDIRITNNLNKEYINVKINTLVISNNISLILFPYDKSFMPNVNQLSLNEYSINKYGGVDTPRYAQNQYDGNCRWRDMVNDTINENELIFTNGCLYVTSKFNFYLRRQDPFGEYGIRSNLFPSDLFGEDIGDKLNNKVKFGNKIC